MKTICIDIDGTISHYIEWVDSATFGEVLPHCAEAVHRLKADGWFVVIYTTRADKEQIAKFLAENNVPFDAINENPNQPENAIGGKPVADVYLDDRAIQFDGHWENVYEQVTEFKPWEENGGVSENPPVDYCKSLLLEDFSQSMNTHRHYDTVNWDITKFTFSEILIAIGACWTIYTFANGIGENVKWLTMAIVCAASWLFAIMALYTIVKNRTYFVRISRHINELRNHVLKVEPIGFKNLTGFWHNPKYPKVKDWCSTQFVSIYMIGILSIALAVATAVFAIKWLTCDSLYYYMLVPIVSTLALLIIIIFQVGKEDFM